MDSSESSCLTQMLRLNIGVDDGKLGDSSQNYSSVDETAWVLNLTETVRKKKRTVPKIGHLRLSIESSLVDLRAK